MRVKMVKSDKRYTKGETVDVSPNVAFGLIDKGAAILSKDMNTDDYRQSDSKAETITKKKGKMNKKEHDSTPEGDGAEEGEG